MTKVISIQTASPFAILRMIKNRTGLELATLSPEGELDLYVGDTAAGDFEALLDKHPEVATYKTRNQTTDLAD